MHLGSIDFALNDIENGHVLSLFSWRTHHDVVGVEQPSHDIQNSGFLNVGSLFLDCKGCVARHQKMAPGSRNQRGQKASHIVIHIAGVPERSCGCCHDC